MFRPRHVSSNTKHANKYIIPGQPANGACQTAQVIDPSFQSTPILTGTTVGANAPNFRCGTGNDSPAVFYQFVGNGARVRLSTCANATDFNTEILLQNRGETCGEGLPFCEVLETTLDLDCDPTGNAVFVEFFTVQDQLYLFAVQSRDIGSSGNFGLSFLEYVRPENDLCESASLIQPRGDTEPAVFGTTMNATRGSFPCGAGNDSPAVFYQFVGTGSQVRLSTCSNATNFNTEILVEDRETCGGSVPFCQAPATTLDTECDPSGQAVFVEVMTETNQLYLVAVQSRDGDGTGDFGLILQAPTTQPPTASTQVTEPPTQAPTTAPPTASTQVTEPPTEAPTLSAETTSKAFSKGSMLAVCACSIVWTLIF